MASWTRALPEPDFPRQPHEHGHFTDKRWDLVLVYHGINDVVLNNCPPGAFRADYSIAYRRYGMQYDLKRHPEVGYFALPYTSTLGAWPSP